MSPPSPDREPPDDPHEESGPVREEDEFDVAAVASWLSALDGTLDGLPEVRQFSGGASNLTYLLHYPDRDLILRRPPPGEKAASAHDMAREFEFQRCLRPAFPYVPRMVGLCQDDALIGSDFYVMERIAGTILRSRIPAELGLDEAARRALGLAAVDLLAELHRVDPDSAGLGRYRRGEGYVGRQVQGWSERFRAAHTWNVPSYERVISWLDRHQSEDVASCVIHNDYRLDNLVLDIQDPRRIVGVLDWEMATVGDPLMDLGGALAYWVQADDDRFMQALRRQPTHLPGMLTRREVVERYSAVSGRPIDDWVFYEVFGLFRLAVIIQQIYRRFHLRQTRNPAFRHYWLAVRYLERRCHTIIRRHDRGGRA